MQLSLFDVSEFVPAKVSKTKLPPSAPVKTGVEASGTSKRSRIVSNERAIEVSNIHGPLTTEQIKDLHAFSGLGGIGVSKDQYFTPSPLVHSMWKALEACGLEPGMAVLEPSCGAGAFLLQGSRYTLTGVEIDPVAGKIAIRATGGHVRHVHITAFEDFTMAALERGRKWQAIIGNAPFGDRGKGITTDKTQRHLRAHELYFLRRGADLLVNNGIMAMIVPAGVMRHTDRAEFRSDLTLGCGLGLIAAYRLSSDLFKDCGAGVLTDLLIFRKGGQDSSLNSLFIDGSYFDYYPEHLLGVPDLDRWGKESLSGAVDYDFLNQLTASLVSITPDPLPELKPMPTSFKQDWQQEAERVGDLVASLVSDQAKGKADRDQRDHVKLQVELFISQYGNPRHLKKLVDQAAHSKQISNLIAAVDLDGGLASLFKTNIEQADREEVPLAVAVQKATQSSLDGSFSVPDILTRFKVQGSADSLREVLIEDPEIAFADPFKRDRFTPMSRYASGQVYDKLYAAKQAYATVDQESSVGVKLRLMGIALKKVMKRTPLEEAHISLRDTWIHDSIKNQFLAWTNRINKSQEYGELFWDTEHTRYRVLDIAGGKDSKGEPIYYQNWESEKLEKYLNHRGTGGNDETEKQRRIQLIESLEADFREWLLGSVHRKDLELRYNRLFNGYVRPQYSQDAFAIPGFKMPEGKSLHGYQFENNRQLIDQGRGINALDVGLGKTLTTIAMVLKLKADGLAKKPGIVVPKSVLANWKAEIEKATEGIRVIYVGERFNKNGKSSTMSAAQREIALKEVALNDWDLVLFSNSTFQQVPLSPEIMENYADREFYDSMYGKKITDYKRAQALAGHETRVALRQFLNISDQTFFDELGIDCLIGDEGHEYKNMRGSRQQSRIRYLPSGEGAKRSYDFNAKANYIRQTNGNRGVYLLTATPTKNNPLEVYAMILHIAPEEWTSRGIMNLEQFIDHFGQIETRTVMDTSGDYKESQCLIGFKNLSQLREILFKYTDMRNAAEVGLQLPESKQEIHFCDLDELQLEDYELLRRRADTMLTDEGEDDHLFSIMHEMEVVAFDPPLIHPVRYPAGYISPKIKAVCQNVAEAVLGGAGGQIIFTNDKFVKSHETIKRCLITLGLKAEEIGLLNGSTAPKSSDRQRIGEQFNKGILKVVITNDSIGGQGVNLQENTSGIHHATLPWTPPDIVQRNGRGLRRGNQQDMVKITTYFAKRTFDAIRNDALMRKADWIGDLWRGEADDYLNLAADQRGGIDPGELQILLSPNPEEARERWEVNQEIAKKVFEDKKRVEIYRVYQRYNRNVLMLARMPKETPEYTALESRLKQLHKQLSESPHFTHKQFLGSDPYGGHYNQVYISPELNRVYATGDYVMAHVWQYGRDGQRVKMILQVGHIGDTNRKMRLEKVTHHRLSWESKNRDFTAREIMLANLEVIHPTEQELSEWKNSLESKQTYMVR